MRRESTIDGGQGLVFGQRPAASAAQPSPIGSQLERMAFAGMQFPRQAVIGFILVLALLAFEVFNFDTTQYALQDLLGGVNFFGIGWATILAIAFCAIDFAGLAHLFTPEKGRNEPKEVWYLMGAWLLGATMNAMMTWWAVSLTLLSHEFGNEVLSREQLLQMAPIFVAVLVWLTRILFIGAISVAGDHLFQSTRPALAAGQAPAAFEPATSQTRRSAPKPRPARGRPAPARPRVQPSMAAAPASGGPVRQASTPPAQPVRAESGGSRIRQRPPRPGFGRTPAAGMSARGRRG